MLKYLSSKEQLEANKRRKVGQAAVGPVGEELLKSKLLSVSKHSVQYVKPNAYNSDEVYLVTVSENSVESTLLNKKLVAMLSEYVA